MDKDGHLKLCKVCSYTESHSPAKSHESFRPACNSFPRFSNSVFEKKYTEGSAQKMIKLTCLEEYKLINENVIITSHRHGLNVNGSTYTFGFK